MERFVRVSLDLLWPVRMLTRLVVGIEEGMPYPGIEESRAGRRGGYERAEAGGEVGR
jgi:hypothetical protein